MLDIEEIKKLIVERLKPLDPEKIILFGSYANGTPNENSDMDLYVVTKDEFIPQSYKQKRDIVRLISNKIIDIRTRASVDLLVHTKKMSEEFFKSKSSFAKEILEKGELIYGKRISS